MRNLSPIVYASVVGLLLACSDSTGPSGASVVSPPQIPEFPAGAFQVSPATATLQPGQTFRFTTTYSGNPALAGTPGDAVWHSSDDNVATVTGGIVQRGKCRSGADRGGLGRLPGERHRSRGGPREEA